MRYWLFSLRKRKNLTQRQVAEACGFSDAYYCQLENGNRNPSVQAAKRIAEVLDFQWSIFFESYTNEMLDDNTKRNAAV